MRVLALVDGEHYPPVTAWGLDAARSGGHDVVGCLFLGGSEKVSGIPDLGVPVRPAGPDAAATLRAAVREWTPEAILDLSDEPILGYRERMELAGVALAEGLTYLGSDFRFDSPASSAAPLPSVAVIGTGKRTGKTAIAGHVARLADAMGLRPVIVAMGRGGPPEPQVARAGSVTVDALLDLVARGHHAASDYLEDAFMTGVTTVGARRCGGGLAGAPFATNAAEAASIAAGLGAGVLILEGSGAAVPPLAWDAGILVVPAHAPPEYLGGYLGPYRLLRSDLVVFTMAPGPDPRAGNLPELTAHARRWDTRYVITDFVPHPMDDVRGLTVFLSTTAPPQIAAQQAARLEEQHGCSVVAVSSDLADRPRLLADLEAAPPFEALLTELKAAAVDVACRWARDRGTPVVFVDNRAEIVDAQGDLDGVLRDVISSVGAS